MQEFLTNNTVSCNLMSLTGYRTLVILQALLESPKSNEEINACLSNNQYIKENFSNDTLRLYINSLREIGCEITKANKTTNNKYVLKSHPFEYDIPKSQVKALAKLNNNFYCHLSIDEILMIEDLFKNLLNHINNAETRKLLSNQSLLKNINREILNDLIIYCKKQNQITFLYNSPKSGNKEIEIIANELSISSEKLYLWGANLTHMQESFFPVDRIIKICCVKHKKSSENVTKSKFVYELYNHNDNYISDPNEKIIGKDSEKLVIEVNTANRFRLMQKILQFGSDCKVVQPESLKSDVIKQLKKMESLYEND